MKRKKIKDRLRSHNNTLTNWVRRKHSQMVNKIKQIKCQCLYLEDHQGKGNHSRGAAALPVAVKSFLIEKRTFEVPSSHIVILEGIYALSKKLRPLPDLRVFVTSGVHFDLVKRFLWDIQRVGQEPEEIIYQISETSNRSHICTTRLQHLYRHKWRDRYLDVMHDNSLKAAADNYGHPEWETRVPQTLVTTAVGHKTLTSSKDNLVVGMVNMASSSYRGTLKCY